MLNGKAKVQRVFQLGGKHAVIEACRNDQQDSSRRRLYIIDGDYELLTGMDAPHLRYLHRLTVYSSENLVFTESAVIEVSVDSLTNKSRTAIRGILDFDAFLGDVVSVLTPLFVGYAAAYLLASRKSFSVTFKNSKYNVMNLCEDDGTKVILSEIKVQDRVEQLRKDLVDNHNVTEGEIAAAIQEIENRLPSSDVDIVKHIPAKTYILPYLYQYLRRRVNFYGNLEQLKVRLARHCELDVDPVLIHHVVRTSQM
jgi:hypothetical protein